MISGLAQRPAAASEAAPGDGERQTTSAVMMVRPREFGFNPEASASNHFSRAETLGLDTAGLACHEFDAFVSRLMAAGVEVYCLDDTPSPVKPDAVFSNNWITTHANGDVVTYPMASANRRLERRHDDVAKLFADSGFRADRWLDLTVSEKGSVFLEGTGSMVLDRPGRAAYACLSERTHPLVLDRFGEEQGYQTVSFLANDPAGRPIYHTNVMMSLGRHFAAVCLEAVQAEDRIALIERLEQGGRTIIDLAWEQVASFAANMLELSSVRGEALIAMSTSAHDSLSAVQRRQLRDLAGELVHSPIPVIEHFGGGSARCMITEIHLPRL